MAILSLSGSKIGTYYIFMGKKKRTTRKRQRGGNTEHNGMWAHCEKYNKDGEFACGASNEENQTMVISEEINRKLKKDTELEKQNARLSGELFDIKQDLDNLTQQLDKVNAQIATLQKEKEDLEKRNQKLQDEKDKGYEQSRKLEEELEQAKSEIDKKKPYLNELRGKKLEELESDNEKLKYKNEKLIDKNTRLEKSLKERTSDGLPKTQTEQMERMEELEAANQELKKEIANLNASKMFNDRHYQSKIEELEQRREKVDSKSSELRKREEDFQNWLDEIKRELSSDSTDDDNEFLKLMKIVKRQATDDDKQLQLKKLEIGYLDLLKQYNDLSEEYEQRLSSRKRQKTEPSTKSLLVREIEAQESSIPDQTIEEPSAKPDNWSDETYENRNQDQVVIPEEQNREERTDYSIRNDEPKYLEKKLVKPIEQNDSFDTGNRVEMEEEEEKTPTFDDITFDGGKRTLPRRKNKTHKHSTQKQSTQKHSTQKQSTQKQSTHKHCTQKQSTHKHRSQKQSTHKHRSQKHIKKKHSPSKVKTRRKKRTIRRRH